MGEDLIKQRKRKVKGDDSEKRNYASKYPRNHMKG